MEKLIVELGKFPMTSSGDVGLVMLVATGRGLDDDGNKVQWFNYKPGFFNEMIRVVWEQDTMKIVLPADVAKHLISRNYARAMNDTEVRDYNRDLDKPETTDESSPKPLKERIQQ